MWVCSIREQGYIGNLDSEKFSDVCTASFLFTTWESFITYMLLLLCFFLFSFFLFGVVPAAYESSWSRGQIRAAAASLYHSHSNPGSELHLCPPQQLTARPDLSPTDQGQGLNPRPHRHYIGSSTCLATMGTPTTYVCLLGLSWKSVELFSTCEGRSGKQVA